MIDKNYKQKDIICTFNYKIRKYLKYNDFLNLKHILQKNKDGEYKLSPSDMKKRFFDFLLMLSKKYNVDMISAKELKLLELDIPDIAEYMYYQILGWINKSDV